MKKIAYMSLAFVLMMAFGHSLTVNAQNEISGTMMVVKGDVKVTSGKSGKTDSAKVGTKVFSGDTIVSGADSRAKIVMSDKNVLNISPDSKITIAKYENDPSKDSRNVELKVDYGKVRAGVEQKYDGEKNKFNIRTPTAVAGVRGTDFMTSFNKGSRQTRIVTFTGVVAAGQSGPKGEILNPVFVKPGMSTSVDSGKPPEPPRPVPAEELKQVNNETNVDTAVKSPGKSEGSSGEGSKDGKDKDGKDKDSKDKNEGKDDKGKTENKEGEKPKEGAANEGSKDAPKEANTASPGGASASTDGSPAGSANGESSPSTAERQPSSTGSLISSADLDPKNTPVQADVRGPASVTTPVFVQPPKVPTAPTPNPFLDNAIRNQKSRVNVKIVPQ